MRWASLLSIEGGLYHTEWQAWGEDNWRDQTNTQSICVQQRMWYRKWDGVCSLRWWRVINNWRFLFFFPTLVQENSERALCKRKVHFVCVNSLHALRFRCERLIAYGYYGMCACTGITVITSCAHGKSKGLRFRGCHFLRILLSHNLEPPHPQIGLCFLAEHAYKLIFRRSY